MSACVHILRRWKQLSRPISVCFHLGAGRTVNHRGCETCIEKAEYINSVSKAGACIDCVTVLCVAEGGFHSEGINVGYCLLSAFQSNCICLNGFNCKISKRKSGSCLPLTWFLRTWWQHLHHMMRLEPVSWRWRNPLWHIFVIWPSSSSLTPGSIRYPTHVFLFVFPQNIPMRSFHKHISFVICWFWLTCGQRCLSLASEGALGVEFITSNMRLSSARSSVMQWGCSEAPSVLLWWGHGSAFSQSRVKSEGPTGV